MKSETFKIKYNYTTEDIRNKEKLQTYLKYKNYALDVFRWENLPPGLESRYIEEALYSNGQCFFMKDEALGFICLKCYDIREMDIYGEYRYGMIFSPNGRINKEVHYLKDGVRILNNDIKEPTEWYIRNYADQMAEVEVSIKENIIQQRNPYLIACNKKNEKSMRNLYNKVKLGEPAIFINDSLNVNDILVQPTPSPYVVDKLNTYKYELEREILTFLGINNSFEKAERLVVDEVNSNNEFIKRNIEIQYKQRLNAVNEINKKYGLNIKVIRVNEKVEDDLQQRQLLALNNLTNKEEEENNGV